MEEKTYDKLAEEMLSISKLMQMMQMMLSLINNQS